ncbi:hypothetical protein [Prosthecobacter sp.]|uniref:hypothetical protein n=1 Tax=Prosthecobacter sp. TaxID=1965333 RepID=UPI003784D05B
MSFTPLKSGGRASNGAHFGFAIRSAGSGRMQSVCFTICGALVKQLRWKDGMRLRLDIDAKAKQGRLMPVDETDKDGRKLKMQPTSGRGQFFFPFSGEALNYFEAYQAVYEFDGVKVLGPGPMLSLVFDLPPAPEREDEEESPS